MRPLPPELGARIEESVKHWLPGVDWRLLAAQLYQESRWEADAVSPVGARGIAQFMPLTWEQKAEQLGLQGGPENTHEAVWAAAAYMRDLWDAWSWPRPKMDRYLLAAASYNAGLGNILKAQRARGNPSLYYDIIVGLVGVTGHHATETQTYAKRILRWYSELVLQGVR